MYEIRLIDQTIIIILPDRDKRSSSRSGRRESEKSNKRSNSTSERYWSGGREEDGHERTRPKHAPSQHDGKGTNKTAPISN